MFKINEDLLMNKIESQVSDIFRLYAWEDVDSQVVQLARTWFFHGVKTGMMQSKENCNEYMDKR